MGVFPGPALENDKVVASRRDPMPHYMNPTLKKLTQGQPVMTFTGTLDANWEPTLIDVGEKNCKKIMGIGRTELLAMGENVIEKMALKNDFKIFRASYSKAMELGIPYSLIYRILTFTGQVKWIFEHGKWDKRSRIPKQIRGIICEISRERLSSFMALEKQDPQAFPKDQDPLDRIISVSNRMTPVYDFIRKAAKSRSNVIITGETGTGKDLVAKAIHELSGMPGDYIPVNCTAVSRELVESEFFGHKKGAFSGAIADSKGYLGAAHNGTLFLDEVGDISLAMQSKLLRAFEDQSYIPVGSNRSRKADFRLITATNRNLVSLVNQGKFRRDFFYRLHVLHVELPPLRDRRGDIPVLADHFLARLTRNAETILPQGIYKVLEQHQWPGNIRELQNVIERYVALGYLIFSSSELAREETSPLQSPAPVQMAEAPLPTVPAAPPVQTPAVSAPPALPAVPGDQPLADYMAQVEKTYIETVLAARGYDMHQTARLLAVSLRTLQRKIKFHGIQNRP